MESCWIYYETTTPSFSYFMLDNWTNAVVPKLALQGPWLPLMKIWDSLFLEVQLTILKLWGAYTRCRQKWFVYQQSLDVAETMFVVHVSACRLKLALVEKYMKIFMLSHFLCREHLRRDGKLLFYNVKTFAAKTWVFHLWGRKRTMNTLSQICPFHISAWSRVSLWAELEFYTIAEQNVGGQPRIFTKYGLIKKILTWQRISFVAVQILRLSSSMEERTLVLLQRPDAKCTEQREAASSTKKRNKTLSAGGLHDFFDEFWGRHWLWNRAMLFVRKFLLSRWEYVYYVTEWLLQVLETVKIEFSLHVLKDLMRNVSFLSSYPAWEFDDLDMFVEEKPSFTLRFLSK